MPTPKAGYMIDGVRVPGTTTVISRFKDSAGLMHWAFEQGKSGRPTLYSEAQRAADIGTLAHSMVQAHVNGEPPEDVLACVEPEMAGKARNAFTQYCHWELESRIQVLGRYQELQLVSRKHRFGGTPDALGITAPVMVANGECVLLDWKSSNAVYSDHLIQLAAYGHLVEHGERMETGEPLGLKVAAFYLLRFSKDFADFEFRRFGELDAAWRQFLLYREAYDNDRELKKRAA